MPLRDQTAPPAVDARDHQGIEPAAALLGERVRALRQARGLSVRTLAARTDFSPSFISQVENGLASPSIASLGRIAEQLGTSLGEFFSTPEGADAAASRAHAGARVLRAAARRVLVSSWSRARVEALGHPSPDLSLEPALITFEPGGRSGRTAHAAPHEMFALVQEGQLTLELAGRSRVLGQGDAATIPPGTPYRWENAGHEPASVLVVGLIGARRRAAHTSQFLAGTVARRGPGAKARRPRDAAR